MGEIDPVPLEDVPHLQLEELLVGEDTAPDAVHAVARVLDENLLEDGPRTAEVLGHGPSLSPRPSRPTWLGGFVAIAFQHHDSVVKSRPQAFPQG
ncbi:hypothetical protein [Streptomyces mutabilis]|uniref:hypothetical protein n=1 Tax=Streptomyces mutabilis TaxID=67332 RepID=UPI001AE087E5|nr:hypothetical protein [Streptomyces mutabilis]